VAAQASRRVSLVRNQPVPQILTYAVQAASRTAEGDIAVGSDEVLTAFPVSNAKPEESVARWVKENSWTLLVAEIPRNERVGESGDETVNEARVPPVNAPA
jgi:hypothetical protein